MERNVNYIADLSNAEENVLYFTDNYKLFKERRGNRGGIQTNRIKYYEDKIRKREFYAVLGHIFITPDGRIVDGHHRFLALKNTQSPVYFMVVNDVDLNMIADFNSGPNSKWRSNDNFRSALTDKAVLAVKMNDLRDNLTSKFGLDEKKISAPEMYGILVKDVKHFGSGKHTPTRAMYFNDLLAKAVNSREFAKNLRLFAFMKNELKNVRDAYKIGKEVMNLAFTSPNFDLEHFCNNLAIEGFILDVYKVPQIREKALAIHNKGLAKNLKAVA